MDETKKTRLEQRFVIVLMVVFLLILMTNGPLKKMLFHSGANRSPADQDQSPKPMKSIPETLKERWDDVAAQVATPSRPAGEADARQGSMTPSYNAHNLRDPMKSLLPVPATPVARSTLQGGATANAVKPSISPPQLMLQGLWWGGTGPQAIINGKIYGVGDRVGGAVITAIDRSGVTAEFEGKSFQVTMLNGPSKKQVSGSTMWRRR